VLRFAGFFFFVFPSGGVAIRYQTLSLV